MKTCSKCGVPKDLSEFHRNAGKPDGVQSQCKSCREVYNAQIGEDGLTNALRNSRKIGEDGLTSSQRSDRKVGEDGLTNLQRNYKKVGEDGLTRFQRADRKIGEDGLTSRQRHRKNNPEKYRDRDFKTKYGFSLEEYKRMFFTQKGACEICKVEGKKLCVDHNHTTGKIRALLCSECNKALGLLKDSSLVAQAAADYLKRFL